METIRLLVLAAFFCGVAAQRFNRFSKRGDCPKHIIYKRCERECIFDVSCPGIEKCCFNGCGGSTCTRPSVATPIPTTTTPKPQLPERTPKNNGACPNPPIGPWVCRSRCAVDSDCKGAKKCCKNRCGAFACVDGVIEEVEDYYDVYYDDDENEIYS